MESAFKEVDVDEDNQLTFEEFEILQQNGKKKAELLIKLKDPLFAQFYSYDTSRAGFLSFADYLIAKTKEDPAAVESDLQELFDSADKDGDKQVNFEEFKGLKLLESNKAQQGSDSLG